MFSIYILTYNEELDIAACIESAMLSDDIIVVDSCSSDRTVEIANRYPVRTIQHAVEYPRKGIWAIAFVTGTMSNDIQAHLPRPMLSIFIPSTPNPTTGWYAIVPEDEVVNLSMPIEDAFKVLVSGGIIAQNTPLAPLAMSKEQNLEAAPLDETSNQSGKSFIKQVMVN
ncbi:DUF502 domain-containing protein [Nodularia spumigena]|uniref:DUF502 domain-containing protein n=1 Tax=Nodularia spumigena TaxID=70799 RepID=UPI003A9094B2